MKYLNYSFIRGWVIAHKITSIIIALVIVFAGYKYHQSLNNTSGQTRYVISSAVKGVLVSSVTGTGQISSSNQVNVVPQVSGTVVGVSVVEGQKVKQGDIIASIDSTIASQQVKNDQLNIETAQLAYDNATKNASDQSNTSSVSDLKKAYDTAYNNVATTFIDMPDIINNESSILYDPVHSQYLTDTNVSALSGSTALQYKTQAGQGFDKARNDFDTNFTMYKSMNSSSKQDDISNLVQQTYNTTKELLDASVALYNTIDYIKSHSSNVPAQVTTDKSQLSTYISKLNTDLNNLSNSMTSIESAKTSGTTATLNLKSAELNLSKAKDTLNTDTKTLYEHSVRAPFDGTIAKLNVQVGDNVSSGAMATLIADKNVAEVSLNEVDAANVKLGDRATLTFDAISGLTITGKVTQVDLLGTVTQGVVNYTMQIGLDVDDPRVRSGMSLSASIITGTKPDVVMVPNSAIKSVGGSTYVQVLDKTVMDNAPADGVLSLTTPTQVPVQVGISNDQVTEIISGISEGDKFISRIIAPTTATATQAPSLFGNAGRGATGGTRAVSGATGR